MWFATLLCILTLIAINSIDHWILKYYIVMAESIPCSDASLATVPSENLLSSTPTSSSPTSSCQLSSRMKQIKIEWSEDAQRYIMGVFCFCVWHRNIFLWYAIGLLLYILSVGRPPWLLAGRLSGMDSSDYFRKHTVKTSLCSMREENLPFQFLLNLYYK